jgi:galactokinase
VSRSQPEWCSPPTDDELAGRVRRLHAQAYGTLPDTIWAAPGRVNLIGEHLDYNGGCALPYALAHRTAVSVSRRSDGEVRCVSAALPGLLRMSVGELRSGAVTGWPAYVAAALWALRETGAELPGMNLAVDSSVPVGAGLSSSAALICAVLLAAADAAGQVGLADDRGALVDAAIRAEREFVGARTGGLDQTASLTCRRGHGLLIDFRDGRREHLPLQPERAGLALVVIDTRVQHDNLKGGYADRRAECEEAESLLGVPSLREVDDLAAAHFRLPSLALRRRVRHVVTELGRVALVADLLRAGHLDGVGDQLTASHRSLRDDFEVSTPELDLAVEAAMNSGALGVRLIGGGFGGSVLALVPTGRVEEVASGVSVAFAAADLAAPTFLRTKPSGPAARIG